MFVIAFTLTFLILHCVIVPIDKLVSKPCIYSLCDGTLGDFLLIGQLSSVSPVSSNTWSALGGIDTSESGNTCTSHLLFLSGYCLLQLIFQMSCWYALVSLVVDAIFPWVILFLVILMYIFPFSASSSKVMTTLIIWVMFNTDTLLFGVSSFYNKRKSPPAWILDLSFMLYNVSLWYAYILSLAWYVTILYCCYAA